MNSEQEFLDTVRQALSDVLPRQNKEILTPRPPENKEAHLDRIKNKSFDRLQELLQVLQKNAVPINLTVMPVKNSNDARAAILSLIQEKEPEYGTKKSVAAWRHPVIEDLNLEPELSKSGISLVLPPESETSAPKNLEKMRQGIIGSFVGITSADYCIADTATLTMKTAPGCPRSVSLVPVIHVAVIHLEQLLEDLSEFYFRLEWDPEEQKQGLTNCMTLISGPSKTGDIELVMVHGAHGPREVYLYVITGEDYRDA